MRRKAGLTLRAHVWVSGRVQGVYFRAYAEDEAAFRVVWEEAQGVTGFAVWG
jgi:acylphosphatase